MPSEPSDDPGEITQALRSIQAGDGEAAEALFEVVYGGLRGLARAASRRVGAGQTLQGTALVHEAWFKLRGGLHGVKDKQHFLAVAGLAMRQILADYARAARSRKRDGGNGVTWFEPAESSGGTDPLDLIALDESLTKLAVLNERHARVVELRFLASLSIEQTAEALGVSHWTVEKDWSMARAWLQRELQRA